VEGEEVSTINESSIRIVFFDFLLIFCTILHASTASIISKSELRIHNSEFRIQNSEFRIQNSEFRAPSTWALRTVELRKFRTQNSEFRIQSPFNLGTANSRTQNSELRIQNSELDWTGLDWTGLDRGSRESRESTRKTNRMSRDDHSKSTAASDLIKNTQNTNRFSSVTSYFLRPKRLLPDPSDQKEKFIWQVPEKPTVLDLRVRPLFERYWRYEPLFWPGF
jgi:hypothetical protein